MNVYKCKCNTAKKYQKNDIRNVGSTADLVLVFLVLLVGLYTGKFISFADYKKEEKKGRESGYAWLLYDSETMDKPIGYVDPGSAPDPDLNKLAKANHPPKKQEQSFIGCQYKGNIYYR